MVQTRAPTLALVDPTQPPRAPFPLVTRRPRLALYANTRAGLDVAWNRAALVCAPARAAFARQGLRPRIGVRLWRLDERGGGQLLARADLSLAEAQARGAARYLPRAALVGGCYRAELGFSGPEGAWLTCVRSERVTVAAPSGGNDGSRASVPRPPPEPGAARPVPLREIDVSAAPDANASSVRSVQVEDTAAPRGGSGPLRPYPLAADEQALWAEVRVEGRAAPGTRIELGGHDYRVGAGGRLTLRFAIADLELIEGLLRQLPPAPVSDRD